MTTTETRWYGVSFGNGNDGVSHMFPAYFVRTDDPWRLARLAAVGEATDKFRDWFDDAVTIDGEEDYTITAMIDEGPEGETEFGAAWFLCEIFPVDDDEVPDQSVPWPSAKAYEAIDDAYSDDLLAWERAHMRD